MTKETVSAWRVTKILVDLLDQGHISDEERLEALTVYFKGLIDGKRQAEDPGRRLEDDEARLEAQGFEDWLRTDPGRRLDVVEARLAEAEDRLRRHIEDFHEEFDDDPTDGA